MNEEKNNLSNTDEQSLGSGHEFLPLDFSESDKSDAGKDSLGKSRENDLPASVAKNEPEKTEAVIVNPSEQSNKEKTAESDAPKETIKLSPAKASEEVPAESESMLRQTTELTEEKSGATGTPANLHDIFPEEKDDDEEFPAAEHKHDPSVVELRQKFESKPEVPSPKTEEAQSFTLKQDEVEKTSQESGSAVTLIPHKEAVRIVGNISSENASCGQILREARVRSGLSLHQVEQETKISMQYLQALEMDDLKNMPPLVYVNAYIKNLSFLYDIKEAETEKILAHLKHGSEHVLDEKMINSLENKKQVSIDEKIKMKYFAVILSSVIALFVIALIIGGIFLAIRLASDEKPKTTSPEALKPYPAKELESLIAPQNFDIKELPISGKQN